jgi:hypothetical protein
MQYTIPSTVSDIINDNYELYCRTVRTSWSYTQKRPYKADNLKESRRIYIHFYYNIDQAADDEKDFDREIISLKQELESGERVLQHGNSISSISPGRRHLQEEHR